MDRGHMQKTAAVRGGEEEYDRLKDIKFPTQRERLNEMLANMEEHDDISSGK